MFLLFQRSLDFLRHPVVRLDPDFPLTGKKLGKTYAISLAVFFAGSILPIPVLGLAIWLLVTYGDPHLALKVITPMFNADHQTLSQTFQTALIATTFCTGFGAEMWYISRVLRRNGRSLFSVIGLSTTSLRGRNGLITAWAFAWRVAVAFAIWFALENALGAVLPPIHQDTQDFASKLSGGNMFIWFIIAGVLAPVFEEIVFRGFLFQALRATFHSWMKAGRGEVVAEQPLTMVTNQQPRGLRKLTRSAFAAIGKLLGWLLWPFTKAFGWLFSPVRRWLSRTMQGTATMLGRRVVNTPGRADCAAVMVSAAVFSLNHMQFQPVALLMLFLMGCFLAEIFRRSGSLWTGILLHALNNGLVSVILWLSH